MGEKLSLVNLKDGQAVELFDAELKKVLANIADQDKADGPREIRLKAKFEPSKDRREFNVQISVESKLAGRRPVFVDAKILVDENGGLYAEAKGQIPITFNSSE